MNKTIVLLGLATLGVVGCAHHRDHARYHHYDATEDRSRTAIVDRHGRTYVREYHRDERGSPYFENNMEPRVRGKHADALGWNIENYYYQRGYRDW